MIIDTTKTKMERDFNIADVQEQLRKTANDPNLVINTVHRFDLTDDERKWIKAFNAQWAKTMKEDYGYDPSKF